MNDVALLGAQIRDEQRSFWRNPIAAGFTVLFPIILLAVFASLNTHTQVSTLGPGRIDFDQYYVPAILAEAVMAACFTNLVIVLCSKRDEGRLKRVRGTPLPPWVYLGGVIGSTLVACLILTVVLVLFGLVAYGITVPAREPALLLTVMVGAFAFCAIGTAVTTLVPNADAAPAVANIVFFPLVALSGAFFPIPAGSTIGRVGSFFPLRHFILAVFSCFDPRAHGSGLQPWDLAVVAIWGVAGLLLSLRRFRWIPDRDR